MDRIEILDGMGPKTSELFHKAGISTIEDLLYYYPKKYHVLKRSDVSLLKDGDKVIIDGMVDGQPTLVSIRPKLKKIIFRIVTQTSIFNVSAYNQIYLYKELKPGMFVTVIGKYDRGRNSIVLSELRMGKLPDKVIIEPKYLCPGDLNNKIISKFVDLAIQSVSSLEDFIPSYYVEKYHFPLKLWSVVEMHHPNNGVSYKKALQRLKYEEFFSYLSQIRLMKEKRMNEEGAIEREFSHDLVLQFINELPFSLTEDQESVVLEIENDMKSSIRMNRLVQGDVGSGKTIVAFIACYINYLSGYQTAFMVPTEILAQQHYQNALELFKDMDISIVLLTSSTKKKKDVYQKITSGNVDLIIGTQSLIQENLHYYNLGLIITDEQHRFGVHQREELRNKGIFPDVLSMSATPIPRTYALTIYGDVDVSSIKTKPSGRKEVITYFKRESEISSILQMMKNELDLKHQIYVIVPSILHGDVNELDNVLVLEKKMNLAFGKIAKIGVIHGKIKPDEKKKVMDSFESGNIDILISTTVIEVGVNVPNASMIVIFQANYFGLSTLHQLRGRVGRGDIQSYCILIAKEGQDRLRMLERCSDGFEISEYDFKTRGEGDLFGIRQSGDAEFKLANIRRDFELLKRVKQDVDDYYVNS